MSLERNKIKTYLGFAIKARKIVYGTDSIEIEKTIKLILYSNLLAESSEKKLMQIAEKKHVPILKIDNNIFCELVQKEQVRAIAITDKSLADAINLNLTECGLGGYFEQNRK